MSESQYRMPFVEADGGRSGAGFRAKSSDCVCRSIALCTGRSYREIYDRLARENAAQRRSKGQLRRNARSASQGIHTSRKWFKQFMTELGFTWTPTMHVGSGCQVHLLRGQLPAGRLVVAVSKHYTAVIDGVVYDTHDPQRVVVHDDGRISGRCVYGYWTLSTASTPTV